MPDLIFDNTVPSNFAAAGKMDLLARLYSGHASTTNEVLDELKCGLERGYADLASAEESVEETRLRIGLDEFLHPGESSCVVFAVSRGMILATDDPTARRPASRRGIRLTGTIGVLVQMVRAKHLELEEANGVLATMIEGGYLAPCARLDDLL